MGLLSNLGSAITGGLTSAAGGLPGMLLSSGLNLLSSKVANDQNRDIVAMQNEANRQLHQMDNEFNAQESQKARDFQVQMFDMTNEYNSPAAQRQRLLQAGINPQNGAVSTSLNSTPSAPSPASAASAPMMASAPFDYNTSLFDSAAHGALALADVQNKQNDTQERLQSFVSRQQKLYWDIQNTKEGTWSNRIARLNMELNNRFLNDTYNNNVALNALNLEQIKSSLMTEVYKRNQMVVQTNVQRAEPIFRSMELGLQEQAVKNAYQSALWNYQTALSEIGWRYYDTNVNKSNFEKQLSLQRSNAMHSALMDIARLKLDRGNYGLFKKQLDLGFKQLEWEKSWKNFGMKTLGGALQGLSYTMPFILSRKPGSKSNPYAGTNATMTIM